MTTLLKVAKQLINAIHAFQESTTSPTVTQTIWVTQSCWLATALKEVKTTGSLKTGQKIYISWTLRLILLYLWPVEVFLVILIRCLILF